MSQLTSIARNDCGRCKNGGIQCGAPTQKWCQNPKGKEAKKGMGCPGIQGNKATLSSTGGPCYYDHSLTDCAICKNAKSRQCGEGSTATKCGNFCAAAGTQVLFREIFH